MREIKDSILHATDETEAFILKHAVWNAKAIVGVQLLEDKEFDYLQYRKVMNVFDKIVKAYENRENELKG